MVVFLYPFLHLVSNTYIYKHIRENSPKNRHSYSDKLF
nr:MAG TPA: hypothetical protein [Caudoviricetes sp.]